MGSRAALEEELAEVRRMRREQKGSLSNVAETTTDHKEMQNTCPSHDSELARVLRENEELQARLQQQDVEQAAQKVLFDEELKLLRDRVTQQAEELHHARTRAAELEVKFQTAEAELSASR